MIAHYGIFEDVSQSLTWILLLVCHVLPVEALKLIIYLVVNLCYGIKGILFVHCFSLRKQLSCTGQNLILTSHELLCSQDFGFRGQTSRYSNSFCQSRFLTATHWPFSLPFNVQAMIPVRSYGFFNLASTSADGCYLYIIIHYGMSWRDWRTRLVPVGGRPDPKIF